MSVLDNDAKRTLECYRSNRSQSTMKIVIAQHSNESTLGTPPIQSNPISVS